MKTLLAAGSRYLKKMDLTDVALLKVCVGALGVLIGLGAAKRHKKGASFLAGLVFMGTWIPLMAKFFSVIITPEDSCDGQA